MKSILVTGASGFFGRNLITAMMQSKDDFRCYCVYHSQKPSIPDSRFHKLQADLLSEEGRQEVIKTAKATHCVHLAWHVPPKEFWTSPLNMDWLFASTKLFQNFAEQGGEVFIGAGSLAEYSWESGVLDEKQTPLMPNTLYGQAKKSLYDLLKHFRNAHHPAVKILWPRIGYFFGPHETEQKLIPKLIESVRKDLPMRLVCPELRRPYAHVQYFSEAILKLIRQEKPEDLTFNLSATHSYSLEEILNTIRESLSKEALSIQFGAYHDPASGPLDLTVKTTALENAVNYTIPETFAQDLRKLTSHI